jgi:pectinesterase
MGAQTHLLSERTREVSAAEPKGMIWQQFLGGTQEERPAVYTTASPLTHLDQGDPPCWFIAGEHDDPSTHADVFRKCMAERGVASGLTVLKDAPHGFIGKQIWFDQMVEKADQFFKDSFKGEN